MLLNAKSWIKRHTYLHIWKQYFAVIGNIWISTYVQTVFSDIGNIWIFVYPKKLFCPYLNRLNTSVSAYLQFIFLIPAIWISANSFFHIYEGVFDQFFEIILYKPGSTVYFTTSKYQRKIYEIFGTFIGIIILNSWFKISARYTEDLPMGCPSQATF